MNGQLIYSHNKIVEAKINMELSKELFDMPIIHCFNGDDDLKYEKYLENYLIKINNNGHFQGAVDLINLGIHKAEEIDIDYLIVTAADTWITDKYFADKIINEMKKNNQVLACSSWGTPDNESIFRTGFSLDFFIIDINWQKNSKFFPLNYELYLSKYLEINFALGGTYLIPERAFSYYWLKYWNTKHRDSDLSAFAKLNMRRIIEREPIHSNKFKERKMEWNEIGLYTYHENLDQKKLLSKLKNKIPLGPIAKNFIL